MKKQCKHKWTTPTQIDCDDGGCCSWKETITICEKCAEKKLLESTPKYRYSI